MFNIKNNNLTEILLLSIAELKGDEKVVETLLKILRLENLTDREYKRLRRDLNNYLEELKDDLKIVAEAGYVDKVYRESYYDYFSTKNNEYSRYCLRLSFFKSDFDFDNDLFDEAKVADNYLGFLILRPMMQCLGRNVIDPAAKKAPKDKIKICSVEINASCLGFKLKVKGFPHASQDSETMTCAQTTIWSLMEYFGNKYPEYRPVSPTEIENILEPYLYKRLLPSGGLTTSQISVALRKFGFGSEIDYNNLRYPENFYERIACYIESGIPLALGMEDACSNLGHEIVCIGREDLSRESVVNYPFSIGSKLVFSWNKTVAHAKFVFNDDNLPCYQTAYLTHPTENYARLGYPGFQNFKITDIVVPLYRKVYMDAKIALDISETIIDKFLDFPDPIVVKTFLTSSRSYRNYISAESGLDKISKIAFLLIPLPKFIWITEISSVDQFKDHKIHSLIILDATGTEQSNMTKNIIFLESFGTVYDYFTDIKNVKAGDKLLPDCFNSFKGNLN